VGIEKLSVSAQVRITRIGRCVPAAQGITVLDSFGKPLSLQLRGHDHFRK